MLNVAGAPVSTSEAEVMCIFLAALDLALLSPTVPSLHHPAHAMYSLFTAFRKIKVPDGSDRSNVPFSRGDAACSAPLPSHPRSTHALSVPKRQAEIINTLRAGPGTGERGETYKLAKEFGQQLLHKREEALGKPPVCDNVAAKGDIVSTKVARKDFRKLEALVEEMAKGDANPIVDVQKVQHDAMKPWTLVNGSHHVSRHRPYEFHKHVHAFEVRSSLGSGMGGMQSLATTFLDPPEEKEVQRTFYERLAIPCETILGSKAKVVIAGGFDDFSEEGSFELAYMKATRDGESKFPMGRESNESSRPTTSTRAEGRSPTSQCVAARD
ncbi:3-oxoacyl-[acyl-carrier-protein] synthase [Tulasnella sp. 424]|nr:3-oxoacyl-[acyl-carrier-protein] synthase [Tulasnella sp. 424]